jgi:hypothetical protein
LRLDEALDVLALRPGATPAEIKGAYRDLVKVWHPDRFGSDVRLREKAEVKLKEINEAYRLLSINPEAGESGYPAVRSNTQAGASPISAVKSTRRRSNRVVVKAGWVYAGLAVSVAFMVGLFVLARSPMRDTDLPHDPVLPVENAKGQGDVETQAARGPEAVISGNDAHAPSRIEGKVLPKEPRDASGMGPAHFSVRPLSDTEALRIETACAKLKEEQTVYQRCIRAQLDLIRNAPRPDLSGLNRGERESIESVCSGSSRRRGAQAYNRCLVVQMADVAAEPVRPDVSTVNDGDRSAVELACRNAKNSEGPAAYDRCLTRTIRLLEQSR